MKNKMQSPLGIIAIFAGLAEVAGTTMITFLSAELQAVFLWYVMLFPVLIVVLFFTILAWKPENFYTPEYYKDERNYLIAMQKYHKQALIDLYENISSEDINDDVREKLEKKIVEIERDIEEVEKVTKTSENILSIEIEGAIVEGDTVKKFYRNIFNYLKANKVDFESLVPYSTGRKRYLISEDNTHINGKDFFMPMKFEKYFIETHKSKVGAKRDIVRFLEILGLDVEG